MILCVNQPWVLLASLQQGAQVLSPDRQHWYGSEEFLALPAQLQKTEMLALKLESLAQSIPLVNPQPQPDPPPADPFTQK